MYAKKLIWLLPLVSLLLIGLSGCTATKQLVKKVPAAVKFNNTPTLFIHGYGGNVDSMTPMIAAIEKAKYGTEVEVIHIRANGSLTTSGTLTARLNNPLINVVFDDSTRTNAKQTADGLKLVIEKLYHQHHFSQFNIVAHSMGNSTLANYLLTYYHDQDLPTLNKYVAIANTSNSFLGGNSGDTKAAISPLKADGQPTIKSAMFTNFSKLHTVFPRQAHILNIYGDLDDHSNSDGRVPINSAKALKYLTAPAASYQEQVFHGKQAQHSKLKRNPAVEQATMKFLFE